MKGSIFALLILILFSIALFLYSGCAVVSPGPDGVFGQVSTPTFSVPGGTYETDQNVTLACSTSGATIYYTLDGSTPTTSSNVYSSPISIPGDENTVTIKAFAVKSGMNSSAIASATYTINYLQVAYPVFSPPEGTYETDQDVSISCATPGATIHYTTDGSDPTIGDPVYSTPIGVAGHGTTMTIKAFAVKAGKTDSVIVSGTYTIQYPQVETPLISPSTGTYDSDQDVTISCGTIGATIYYTTDGSDPTTLSTLYSSSIPVTGDGTSVTIKAFATKTDMLNSVIASSTITIDYSTVSTPQFSPPGGTYNAAQSVTITCATTGATIYYTTDGSDPTIADTEYTAPIDMTEADSPVTIKAIGVKAGMSDSSIAQATYTIQYWFIFAALTETEVSGPDDADWWIKKIDSGGNDDTVNWNKTFGGDYYDQPGSVAIDSSNNVYVAGYYDNQTPGTEEVTDITCVADSSGNLDGTYFTIYRPDDGSEEQYYVWYAVDGYANTDPAASGTGIRVDILENATAGDVANKTAWSLINWDTSVSGDVVTVTNYDEADVTDATNGTVPGAFTTSVNTQGVDTVYDYQWWIKKFDADGNEDTINWDKKIDIDAEEEPPFYAVVIALDSSDNLYVAGATYTDDSTYFDWMIKKYSSDGTEDLTWNLTFPSSGWGDSPLAMDFDLSDNLYVVGMQDNSATIDDFDDPDWWVKKFNSSGVEDTSNWDKVLDNLGGLDASLGVGVDSSDNVYVAGIMADAPAGSPEVTEITCLGDSTGDLNGTYFTINFGWGEYYVWYHVAGYSYSDPMVAGKEGIMVDISEDALAGEVATETSLKLSNYGFDTSILGSVVTVSSDVTGNVTDAADGSVPFDTGFSFSIADGVDDGDLDWVLKKYSSTGTEVWSELIDFGTQWNLPYSMAIDSANNIYVAGYREISDDQENWVIKKFDLDGNEDTTNWDKSLNSGNGSWEEACSVIVDSEDNVYVTGGMWNGPADGIPEETVISCVGDSSGSLDGTYFELYMPYEEYYIWYAVSGYSNTDPSVSGKAGIKVDIAENASASDVASETASALYPLFDVSISGADVTGINYSGGNVTDAANGTPGPGFSFSITDGVDPGDMDWVIKKFSPSGTELWSKEFDSGSGNNDGGYAGAAFN